MKFDPSSFPATAKTTGFQPDNLEKVLRLRELLTEFQKHSFLRGKLVLKGGTALNLFYLGLTRLSVDIDLNYIATVNRETMLAERSDIVKAVEQIAIGLGYKFQNGVDDHALREWHLGYANHVGAQDRIQVEINFLMRACALPPRVLPAASIVDSQPCEFLVLATEELFAGKIKAMIDRRHPRDLYDLYRFTKSGLAHDPEILRKLAVLFCSTMDRDFRAYSIDRASDVDTKQLDRLLYPLLKADDRPQPAEMLAAARPLLAGVLEHSREEPYLAAMASGKYQPELLFSKNPEIVERIRFHPALLWKAQNVTEHLANSKKFSQRRDQTD
jgi:predicted nucleotidyltransferase component of viral defense system